MTLTKIENDHIFIPVVALIAWLFITRFLVTFHWRQSSLLPVLGDFFYADDARVSRTRNTENGDPPHSSTAALPAPDISPPDPDSQTSSRPSNQSSRSDDEVTKPSTRNRRKFGPTLPDELRARLTGETGAEVAQLIVSLFFTFVCCSFDVGFVENVAEDSTGSMERSEDNEDKPTKRRKRNRKVLLWRRDESVERQINAFCTVLGQRKSPSHLEKFNRLFVEKWPKSTKN